MMWSGITITCFAASYGVALALEVSRFFFRTAVRTVIMLAFGVAGLFAHSMFLYQLARSELRADLGVFASWYDWCLLAAWVLAVAYTALALRRPQNTLGIFLLPLLLGLIGIAQLCQDLAPFSTARALSSWRFVHGLSLLVATVAVSLGCATGIMYLLQSYRLKHKLPPRQGLKLPSLEWLQRFNKESLWISTGLVALGVISGVVLNLSTDTRGLLWTDSVVVTSSLLFIWLLVVMTFEYFYKPARQGRKVAYLTLASFVFLGLALVMVLFGGHGSEKKRAVSFGSAEGTRHRSPRWSRRPPAEPWVIGEHKPHGPVRAAMQQDRARNSRRALTGLKAYRPVVYARLRRPSPARPWATIALGVRPSDPPPLRGVDVDARRRLCPGAFL